MTVALCAPVPGALWAQCRRGPQPFGDKWGQFCFPSQIPSECLGKRYLAQEERLCTAFSVLHTVIESGKESAPGDTRGALLKGLRAEAGSGRPQGQPDSLGTITPTRDEEEGEAFGTKQLPCAKDPG